MYRKKLMAIFVGVIVMAMVGCGSVKETTDVAKDTVKEAATATETEEKNEAEEKETEEKTEEEEKETENAGTKQMPLPQTPKSYFLPRDSQKVLHTPHEVLPKRLPNL